MKDFFKILLNNVKQGLFDFVTDVLLSSMAEHRRAKQSGEFDVLQRQRREQMRREYEQKNSNEKNDINIFKNL